MENAVLGPGYTMYNGIHLCKPLRVIEWMIKNAPKEALAVYPSPAKLPYLSFYSHVSIPDPINFLADAVNCCT